MNGDHQGRTNGAASRGAHAASGKPKPESVLAAALRLGASGLPIFFCKADKRPTCPGGFKAATSDRAAIIALWRDHPGELIGVPTGQISGLDVVDVDPRHGGDEWEEEHRARLPATRLHETMSGGRHYVLVHEPGMRNSASLIAAGVDVRADGGYFITPPSAGYRVLIGTEPARWPEWLLPLALKPVAAPRPVRTTPAKPISSARMDAYIKTVLAKLQNAAEGAKHDALRAVATTLGGVCEQAGLDDEDATAMLLEALPGTVQDWKLAERTAQWGLTKGRAAPIELEDRPNPRAKTNGATHPPPQPEPPSPDPAIHVDTPKKPKKKGLNALALVTFMAASREWRGALRINLFTQTLQVCDPFPPAAAPVGAAFRPLEEPADLLEAMLSFQESGFTKASKGLVWDGLCVVAHRNAFHPVRNYLSGLRWDGEPRLGRLFQDYFNAEMPDEKDQPAQPGAPAPRDAMICYLEHISKAFMVSAVARIRNPGCKVDSLPVLVGPQGYHKSQAIRALCADPAWFSDDLSTELMERDTKESLTGKWVIELSEMPHAQKEIERVKAFFSRQSDRYRRAYDRMTNDWPRQCVFMGSSNDLELIDHTGNRRFWPVELAGPIDVERITADRNQLWAEAVALYEDDYAWWLAPSIELLAGEQQGRFRDEDVWTDVLSAWIEQIPDRPPFTLVEAMSGAFPSINPVLIPKVDHNRAAKCLKALGYKRRKGRRGTRTPWLWIKTPPPV